MAATPRWLAYCTRTLLAANNQRQPPRNRGLMNKEWFVQFSQLPLRTNSKTRHISIALRQHCLFGTAPLNAAERTAYALLAPGAIVGQDSTFITADTSLPSLAWSAAGGVNGYLGFRFKNPETGVANYGYVRMDNVGATGTTGLPARIVSYAYDSSGAAITIPTP
jgi:hypothetical protein